MADTRTVEDIVRNHWTLWDTDSYGTMYPEVDLGILDQVDQPIIVSDRKLRVFTQLTSLDDLDELLREIKDARERLKHPLTMQSKL